MASDRKILVVEDDPSLQLTLATALEAEGYAVAEAASAEQAMDRLASEDFPVILTDIYMQHKTGLDLLHRARALNPQCAVILMTGKGSLETVLEATRGGAFDYLSKPFSMDRLHETVRGAFRAAQGTHAVEPGRAESREPALIGNSPAMVEVYKFVSRVAPTDATVLLAGETGTGKELAARLIHQHSPRARARLVVVDCAALKDTLLETELFGAVRGAYTGADRDRAGLLQVAEGGTVFLDEIGEIDPGFQLRLLRFLQEKEVRPVGATASRKVDVRVIAATNRDLKRLAAEGRFREDLWYRLNVASVHIPPLRERPEDVPVLVEHFLAEFAGSYGRRLELGRDAMLVLSRYSWPGNVRQLRHVLENLVILSPSPVIEARAVENALQAQRATDAPAVAVPVTATPERAGASLESLEEEHIRRVLEATGGNKSRAAAILGIERKTLYRKLERMEKT